MSEYDSGSTAFEDNYIAYPKAMTQLAERLEASPEELAAWLFVGPELGGLAAYVNANELEPPPEFRFGLYTGDNPDYLSPLMWCWFQEDDVLNFTPTERYITGTSLKDRWNGHLGMQPEAFIRAKIEESRLHGFHPISGLTQGSVPGDEWYPPLSSGLFALSEIKALEKEDFGSVDGGESVFHESPADVGELEVGSPEWRSQNARNAANARHDQAGGTRDKQQRIRDIWATGKYKTRVQCAEQEHEKLGMSLSAALKALRNTPNPKRPT